MNLLETGALIHVVLSLVATVVIVRSAHLEKHQVVYQACLVWLVPLIGATTILIFHSVVHRNMSTRAEPHQASNNSDDPLAADLYTDLADGD